MELIPTDDIINSLPQDVRREIYNKAVLEKNALNKMGHKQLQKEVNDMVDEQINTMLKLQYTSKMCFDLDSELNQKEEEVNQLEEELKNQKVYIDKLEFDAKRHNHENIIAKNEYLESKKKSIKIFTEEQQSERLLKRANELVKNYIPKFKK